MLPSPLADISHLYELACLVQQTQAFISIVTLNIDTISLIVNETNATCSLDNESKNSFVSLGSLTADEIGACQALLLTSAAVYNTTCVP